MVKFALQISVGLFALAVLSQGAPAPEDIAAAGGAPIVVPGSGQQLFYGIDRNGNTIIANQRGEIVGSVNVNNRPRITDDYGPINYDSYRGSRYRDRDDYDDDESTLARLFRFGRRRRGRGGRRGRKRNCRDNNDNVLSSLVEVMCEFTDGLFSD